MKDESVKEMKGSNVVEMLVERLAPRKRNGQDEDARSETQSGQGGAGET